MFIKFLLAIIITEAITEIVTKSEIFSFFRAKVFYLGQNNKVFEWFHKLLDCGYCFSFWAGMLSSFILLKDINLINCYLDPFLIGIVLHRLSNLLHNIMDRVHKIE